MSLDALETLRTRRLTLAIGLFEGFVAVRSALRDLANHGFGSDRVKVVTVAGSRTFDHIVDDWEAETQRAASVQHVETCRGVDATDCISRILHDAVPARAAARASPRSDDEDAGETFVMSGLERQADNLRRHLAEGGGILIVRVEDAVEQQAVCSMLLHYASRGVQTHQLRLEPRRSGAGGGHFAQGPA